MTDPKPEDVEAAKRLAEYLEAPQKDRPQLKIKARVTIRKFEGDDQTKEPVETIVSEDEGFTDFVKEHKNAAD